MRFHKNLIITFSISIIASFIFFLLVIYINNPTPGSVALLVYLGWIFWLGIFSFLVRVFLNSNITIEWFQESFFWGTIILCVLHIILIIASAYYAAVLLHKWN